MSALIGKLCTEGGVELLQVEFTQMAHYRDRRAENTAILVEHDLTFTLYRQSAPHRRGYNRWLAYERQWMPRFDAVWTMSDEDRAEALAEGAPTGRTVTVGNGVDISRFVPLPQAAAQSKCSTSDRFATSRTSWASNAYMAG
jgi:glycosyltransferase involved in cell wall biosynthesis